jgi:hypothetical protein
MIEELKNAFARYCDNDPMQRRLEIDDAHVRLWSARSGHTLWSIEWERLDEIVAYKVDAMTVDHLCLAFRERDSATFHVTDEETPGWQELNAALATRFGIQSAQWFERVAFPAFAQNWTVLWSRAL